MKTYLVSFSFLLLSVVALAQKKGSVLTTTPSHAPTKVAILLFPGAELLDFAGPLEVFSHMDSTEVFTVAAQAGPMRIMQRLLTLTPDYTLATVPPPDILVIPGGRMDDILGDSTVVNWIQRTNAHRQLTLSVCTGAFLLGKAGLLNGKTVTTHWGATDLLQRMTPKATVMEHTRFVDQGALITTAGVSAGIDGALQVVSRFRGLPAARQIARIMEYDKWEPDAGLIVGQLPRRSKVTTTAQAHKPVAVKKTGLSRPLNAHTLSSSIDPVCQMSVAESVADTAHYAGQHYGFCSKLCKERFKRQPAAYVNALKTH